MKNILIPTATKAYKTAAKRIQQCAKALLAPGVYDSRLYVKYAYVKDNILHMTNSKCLVKFDLKEIFGITTTPEQHGFYSLATINKELYLVPTEFLGPDTDRDYPETEDLFKVKYELKTTPGESLSIRYAQLLFSMSTYNTTTPVLAVLDLDLFKLVPDDATAYTGARTAEDIVSSPVVFRSYGVELCIMPLKIK